MSLIVLAEKRKTSPPIFVFRITSLCHCASGQAHAFSMYPRRWLWLGSQAKAFHTSLREAPLLVGDKAEVVSPSATST